MFDRAILARGIHGLQHHQQRVAAGSVKKILQLCHLLHMFDQLLLVFFPGLVKGFDPGGPLLEVDARVRRNAKGLGFDVHGNLLLPEAPRRNLFWLLFMFAAVFSDFLILILILLLISNRRRGD